MQMQNLSTDELLDRLEWRREIRNVMGRISHDYAVKEEAQVFDRYWTRTQEPCLGINTGYYKGREAVAGYYQALGEEIALTSRLIQQRFPAELGNLTEEEAYGVGMMTYLPFDSHVIEIAGDGQTAKGIWNVRGSRSYLTTAGPVANWTYGWTACDFIREDGEWRVLNMLLVYNIDHQCGVGFTEAEKVYPPEEAFAEIAGFQMPAPNVPCTVMETFSPNRPLTRSPAVPVPYESFAETFSYGI